MSYQALAPHFGMTCKTNHIKSQSPTIQKNEPERSLDAFLPQRKRYQVKGSFQSVRFLTKLQKQALQQKQESQNQLWREHFLTNFNKLPLEIQQHPSISQALLCKLRSSLRKFALFPARLKELEHGLNLTGQSSIFPASQAVVARSLLASAYNGNEEGTRLIAHTWKDQSTILQAFKKLLSLKETSTGQKRKSLSLLTDQLTTQPLLAVALKNAAAHGNVPALQQLWPRVTDPTYQRYKEVALFEAIENGHLSTVNVLLPHVTDPEDLQIACLQADASGFPAIASSIRERLQQLQPPAH